MWQRRFASTPNARMAVRIMRQLEHKVSGSAEGLPPRVLQARNVGRRSFSFFPHKHSPALREDHSLNSGALKSVSVCRGEAEWRLSPHAPNTYPAGTSQVGLQVDAAQEYMPDDLGTPTRLLMGAVSVRDWLRQQCDLHLRLASTPTVVSIPRSAVRGSFPLVAATVSREPPACFAGGGLGLLFASWGGAMLRSALN